jgi:pyridoxamine 5'-phosphate oxidase family protein
VAFVVDDVLPPWRPRFVEIRGTVEGLNQGGKSINPGFNSEILRLTPTYIVSFGVSGESLQTSQGVARPRGRKVA